MSSDRHPHSNLTGAPAHFQRTTDGPRQREFLPPRAFAIVKEQKNLIERTVSEPSSSQQPLLLNNTLSLCRVNGKLERCHYLSLMVRTTTTRTTMRVLASTKLTTMTTERTKMPLSSPWLLRQLTRRHQKHCILCNSWKPSGFEGTPREESDAIHSLIDHLPLSNFMPETEDTDEVLNTHVGRRHYNPDTISQIVRSVSEQLVKPHWGSCAPACFERSMDNCVPNSFVVLEKEILTADGGCNSDGMAWRRYHIPIDESWIALGLR